MIESQSIDFLRMAATHAGGITALKKIANFAAVHQVRMAPHGPPDISPIGHAAHAHLNIWVPNFGIQEFVGFGGDHMKEVFSHPLTFEDGYISLSNAPGLGVEFDEEQAKKHPYNRSYLPVSRLEDGSMWDW